MGISVYNASTKVIIAFCNNNKKIPLFPYEYKNIEADGVFLTDYKYYEKVKYLYEIGPQNLVIFNDNKMQIIYKPFFAKDLLNYYKKLSGRDIKINTNYWKYDSNYNIYYCTIFKELLKQDIFLVSKCRN